MSCGCAQCRRKLPHTPEAVGNRAGLSALHWRAGRHDSFRQAMLDALHQQDELKDLTTRAPDDPAIALIDAWAVVGDVLTFYTERLANEAYLRTATQSRSVREIAQLVGYTPRPGVAASVDLAFRLDDGAAPVTIPAGTRVMSTPLPGQQMQTFETKEALKAGAALNAMRARQTRPQRIWPWQNSPIWLKGISTGLERGSRILIGPKQAQKPEQLQLRVVRSVRIEPADDRTMIELDYSGPEDPDRLDAVAIVLQILADKLDANVSTVAKRYLETINEIKLNAKDDPKLVTKYYQELRDAMEGAFSQTRPDSPVGPTIDALLWLVRDALLGTLDPSGDASSGDRLRSRALQAFTPADGTEDGGPSLWFRIAERAGSDTKLQPFAALRGRVDDQGVCEVQALRVAAAPFGHNAPPQPAANDGDLLREWPLGKRTGDNEIEFFAHNQDTLYLETEYAISQGGIVVVERGQPAVEEVDGAKWPRTPRRAFWGVECSSVSLSAFGISGKSTRLVFPTALFETLNMVVRDRRLVPMLSLLRPVRIYAGNEKLELAEEPIAEPVCTSDEISLDDVYEDLTPGRRLIMEGERFDVPGVVAHVPVMVASVAHSTDPLVSDAPPWSGPGNRALTRITLAADPQDLKEDGICFVRESVRLLGNVVRATHGETRREVLGSGDASQPFQSFELRQAPLTYVSAPTPDGIANTLEVRVDGLRWHEAPNFAGLSPDSRSYVVEIASDARTRIGTGDGSIGARLPTGIENVTAIFRQGIGRDGNVGGDQINLLGDRPLGVAAVRNLIAASGGANRESVSETRTNAPLAAAATDRLISLDDYQSFAQRFAGIAKARSARSSVVDRPGIVVTVAGADDQPVNEGSDLMRNLSAALRRFGDPRLPVRVEARERLVLFLRVRIALEPDHAFDVVEPAVRARLLSAIGFEAVGIGERLARSRVAALMQSVSGVSWIDIDAFTAIEEGRVRAAVAAKKSATISSNELDASQAVLDVKWNQIAYFDPELPETLILSEITP